MRNNSCIAIVLIFLSDVSDIVTSLTWQWMILCSSQFCVMTKLPKTLLLTLKLVRNDIKITFLVLFLLSV